MREKIKVGFSVRKPYKLDEDEPGKVKKKKRKKEKRVNRVNR